MEKSYDVAGNVFSGKANEGMIAFAGVAIPAIDALGVGEGVLKIAAFVRPDGNGYLTLTFVFDLESAPNRDLALKSRFARIEQTVLAARLGADFEMLLAVPLNTFAESAWFYLEELNLYFRCLAGRERWLLEERIVPLLAELLDAQIEPLNWPAAPRRDAPELSESSQTNRLLGVTNHSIH